MKKIIEERRGEEREREREGEGGREKDHYNKMVVYHVIASVTAVTAQLYGDFIIYKTWASNSP